MSVADWQDRLSGFAGSGLVHVAGFAALVIGAPIAEPGCRLRADAMNLIVQPSIALFDATSPLPRAIDRWRLELAEAGCGGASRLDAQPMLASSGAVDMQPHSARVPRLCARIGADGRVLAARVWRSSGSRVVDARLEARVRRLTFTPALRDGRAVPASVTLDLVGWTADTTSVSEPVPFDPAIGPL